MGTINLNGNRREIQSPYIHNQAVGANPNSGNANQDICPTGIYTRWDLMDKLADVHIPKGNLFSKFAKPTGFNKNNDFVKLYRAEYNDSVPNFTLGREIPNNTNYHYYYANGDIVFTIDNGSTKSGPIEGRFKFVDKAKALAMQTLHPDPMTFLNVYSGEFSIEFTNRLVYKYSVEINFDLPTDIEKCKASYETISTSNKYDSDSKIVIHRERNEFDLTNNRNTFLKTVTGENINEIRLSLFNIPWGLIIIQFETYEDTFDFFQDNEYFQEIGDFGLTNNDTQAFTWFQGVDYGGSGDLALDWNKYDLNTILNANNYQDRWLHPTDGVKVGVEEFVLKSVTDPKAIVNYQVSTDPSEPDLSISLLDMLRLSSTDYHIARMLGLGHLDLSYDVLGGNQYMYAAVYFTVPSLPFIGENVGHIALSLPTSINNQRMPLSPILNPIQYGITLLDEDGENPRSPMSDEKGYSFTTDTRFISIHKTNQQITDEVKKYIPDNNPFDGTQITAAARFGIEYKEVSESDWRNPEILHNSLYFDNNGIAEPNLIPESDKNPLYTHWVQETGVHEYALYAVNIFSRYSGLSNIEQTDLTEFPKKNSLIPPSNLNVQYIQEEEVLILTTQAEQDALQAANINNPSGDNCKLRVLFDWDEIHSNSYQYGDTAEFFFRENPPKKVEGKILKIIDLASPDECLVETTGYSITSITPKLDIFPSISTKEISTYLNSFLCTPEGQFRIVEITPSQGTSVGAIFKVKNISTLQANQTTPDGANTNVVLYTPPKTNDSFFVIENIGNPNSWQKLDQTIQLIAHSTTQEIVYTENEPNVYSERNEFVGGIFDTASIEPILDQHLNIHTGGYKITFTSLALIPHPQNNVHWYKGYVRLKIQDKPTKKRVKVVNIEEHFPKIVLNVFDADFISDPLNRVEANYNGIVGLNFEVNYHPGYRVYLDAESTTDFNSAHIMPVGTTNNKKTFFAIRSKDSTLNISSSISNPCTIVARNIQKPVTPLIPLSATFATRPDHYSKSSFGFDIEFNSNDRTPFGAVIYRSSEMAILQALYKPDTVIEIINELKRIEAKDIFKVNRWRGLINVDHITPPSPFPASFNFSFLNYGEYTLPIPNNDETEIVNSYTASTDANTGLLSDNIDTTKPFVAGYSNCTSLAQFNKLISHIKKVIDDQFVPVTETPIILEYLKNGYQTSNKKPTYKDIIGRLLEQNDPLFDPFPMAVRLSLQPYKIRFTDYTINGAANNIYFYFVKEVALNMKQSERTQAIGPIYLVNANPPNPPKIRTIIVQEQINGAKAGIVFELADYLDAQNITAIQIFRTTNFENTANTRTMNLAATINLKNENLIIDDFRDLESPPFAQTLYYRLVALKKIINENNQDELVPSEPSEVVLTNIFDLNNPKSPIITPSYTTTNINGIDGFENCILSWDRSKGCYNATFRIYKINAFGNWELLWVKKSNQNSFTFPENNDFTSFPIMAFLPKFNEDGNEIFHRFKVEVENASGLLSSEENILIL